MRAVSSRLSAWHVVGRYLPPRWPWWAYGLKLGLGLLLMVALLVPLAVLQSPFRVSPAS